MVYRGRPSKGCSKCRKKKIKCDEKLPGCTQCVRAGTTCPGYRDQLDLMFLDESASVVEKIQRQQEPNGKAHHDEPAAKGSNATSRSSSSTRREKEQQPKPSNALVKKVVGTGVDPFDTFAVPLRPEMQPLLHSFVVAEEPLVPLGPFTSLKDVWLPMVMSDELVFNAMLYHASSGPGKTSASDLQVMNYQTQTIRLLNERLGDPTRAVTKETIAVVLGLMVRAIVAVDYSTARLHMSGLGRMISHGGGLEGIGLHPIVQEALFWADICYAVLEIINELRIQINIFEMAKIKGISAAETVKYNESLDMVEDRISSFSDMTDEDNLRPPYDNHVLQSCRVSSTIFIKLILRNETPCSPLLFGYAQELKTILEDTDLPKCWTQLGYLLLWIQFMGCLAARGGPLYTTYLKYFIYTCEYLKLQSQDQVRDTLAKFLWAESVCNDLFLMLWNDARMTWVASGGGAGAGMVGSNNMMQTMNVDMTNTNNMNVNLNMAMSRTTRPSPERGIPTSTAGGLPTTSAPESGNFTELNWIH